LRYCCMGKMRTSTICDTVVQIRGLRRRECTAGDAQAEIDRFTIRNIKENGWFREGCQNLENQTGNILTIEGSSKLVNGRRGTKSTRTVCDTVARQKNKLLNGRRGTKSTHTIRDTVARPKRRCGKPSQRCVYLGTLLRCVTR